MGFEGAKKLEEKKRRGDDGHVYAKTGSATPEGLACAQSLRMFFLNVSI